MAKAASVPTTLAAILADTYALAVKTHGAHWNVTGNAFFALHEAFSVQYLALFEAADEIAERLRALGETAPGSIGDLAELSSLPAAPRSTGEASLVAALRADHAAISKACAAGVAVAQKNGDEVTADLLIGRGQDHDKTAWMLGATLGR